jgi:hypothetical protein
MAYSSIVKPTDYFNTVLYTGNGSTQSITGVGFQPDWVWVKSRSNTTNHSAYDIIRGVQQELRPNSTDAGATRSTGLTSFDSDGFSAGSNININNSGYTYASWNWLAGGTASSNSDGDITSTVSANTAAGFSIVSYTGTGTASDTVGHGLGVTPAMIIVKNRTEATSWCVTHKSLTTDKVLRLDGNNAEGDIGDGELDSPPNNSSTFGFNNGTSGTPLKVVNESSDNYIAYCFAEKKGYSKFGSYTGNASTDGTFVYTGFKPAFIIGKITSDANEWFLIDNKRSTFNVANKSVYANTNAVENTNHDVDFLSNGFKIRDSDGTVNVSGGSYIYLAFAENPFVANDSGTAVPVVAR